jgi:hypothetical protein
LPPHFTPRVSAKRDPQVPAMLASLVTNDNPDILATAYAPPAPDYARQSPFSSVLREETQRGRFIPPVTPEDHAWAATALPRKDLFRIRTALPGCGHLFRSARGIRQGPGRRRPGDSQPGPQPDLSETPSAASSTRTNWRNRCQFSFACDGIKDRVRSPKHWDMAEEIALATTAGKIWLNQVGLFDPLSCHLCEPALGKENAQGWQDRPPYFLRHLWRRLVLID